MEETLANEIEAPEEPHNIKQLGGLIGTIMQHKGLTNAEVSKAARVPINKIRDIEEVAFDMRFRDIVHIVRALGFQLQS